jgi:glycosyltransferase involved in cell wall biosynthesis
MASGVPVVATAAGGNLELIDDGYSGRLFPPGAVTALVQILAGYVLDPLLRRAHAVAARRIAVERFSLGTMVTKYQEIYLGLCGGMATAKAAAGSQPTARVSQSE